MANSLTQTPDTESEEKSNTEVRPTSTEVKEKHDEYLFSSVINYYSEKLAIDSVNVCILKEV